VVAQALTSRSTVARGTSSRDLRREPTVADTGQRSGSTSTGGSHREVSGRSGWITLDVIVIYALIVHGRELKDT